MQNQAKTDGIDALGVMRTRYLAYRMDGRLQMDAFRRAHEDLLMVIGFTVDLRERDDKGLRHVMEQDYVRRN